MAQRHKQLFMKVFLLNSRRDLPPKRGPLKVCENNLCALF